MKMTKRIAAMVACAVMAASSMVGMSASAGFSSTMLEPNGNPVNLTINGEKYGFQVRSDVRTDTLSSGKIKGTASTYLYEVNGKAIPTGRIFIQSYLYAKNSNGTSFVLSGTESNDPLYMQSASCVYKNVSSRSFDDYSSYAAGGYVNISYGSIGEVKTIPSSNTSFVS